MSDLSIEFSLNTPLINNSNILEKKIFDLLKTSNMIGGSTGLGTYNCIKLLIGIIIIIIGFILLIFKNDLVETEAIIKIKSCDDKECKININYIIKDVQYSKIITINKNNYSNGNKIKIYYHESNPNSIQLYKINYSLLGIVMIIVGIFIIIFSSGSKY